MRVDPFRFELDTVDELALRELWETVWGHAPRANLRKILSRSLGHVAAYDRSRLVGFVNVAWDGGEHAFILDTAVHPEYRRQKIGTRLVNRAVELAKQRGARWLHVDFEPRYAEFYRRCGFRSTDAGLIAL